MQIMFLLPMKWHVTKNTNGANWEICQIKKWFYQSSLHSHAIPNHLARLLTT